MNLQEQINQAETRIFKTVFPNTTNHYYFIWRNSSFMMDEVAFITATRFTRKDELFLLTKLILPSPSQLELLSYRHGNSYWKYQLRRES
jgi:hypothetical protein